MSVAASIGCITSEAVNEEGFYMPDSVGAGQGRQATGVAEMITETLELGGNWGPHGDPIAIYGQQGQ